MRGEKRWTCGINFKDVVNKCSTSLSFQTGFRGGIFACQRDINSEALWEQQTWEAAAFIYSPLQPVLRSIPKSCCTLFTSYSTQRRAFNLVTLSPPAARGCSLFFARFVNFLGHITGSPTIFTPNHTPRTQTGHAGRFFGALYIAH